MQHTDGDPRSDDGRQDSARQVGACHVDNAAVLNVGVRANADAVDVTWTEGGREGGKGKAGRRNGGVAKAR